MPRGVVDLEGLKSPEAQALRPHGEWAEAHSLEDAIRNAPPGQDTTRHAK